MPRRATTPTTRKPLTRERVLRAAVALADEEGIDALSMRRLGQRLGVEAMSLYNHVADKDDVHRGMVEFVHEQIELPPSGLGWKEAIRRTAVSSHQALLRHRWACALSMSVASPNEPQMQWMEDVLRTFREAGFSPDLTHHAYHAIDSHITGFTLWLVSMPFETREELVELAAEFVRSIPSDRYPHVVEHAYQHLEAVSPDGPTEFEFGLDLILDGLERLLRAEPRRA
ncbi:MAG: TetR/AcrR family transcriptional regulator C-terminal domain-containing protein [Thermoleophilia bacterium]|nr:TetR/AcrR family transcriptional regulator C-terminal domain-containing protein [Thermoleophilia bacterium]MDH4345749.1 TetR/AcrR family transcriptional regulator C-terminal domain-containing protein [Thermoleophilia bacterium]MDH5332570.1 TetR/AcrR family transcriptional regulator C-terminal domain-containing protein [Thermoleophilia bacterium]